MVAEEIVPEAAAATSAIREVAEEIAPVAVAMSETKEVVVIAPAVEVMPVTGLVVVAVGQAAAMLLAHALVRGLIKSDGDLTEIA